MNSIITTAPPYTARVIAPVGGKALAAPSVLNTNLDFLRSFAVALVLFGHVLHFHGWETIGPFNLDLMGGLGVLLFFVHTCCVLMSSLERQEQSGGRIKFFVSFMIRRVFRIYPLGILAVLLVVLLHLPLAAVAPGHFSGFRPDSGDLIANLFLVMNLSHRAPVLGPMWSLPYEIQMYLLLPGLFLFVAANRGIAKTAIVWTAAIALGVLVLRRDPNPNFVTYVPCFLPGILAYQLQRRYRPHLPAFLWPPTVALLATVFLWRQGDVTWPIRWALCLFIGLGIPLFSGISAPWLVRSTHLVAKYSYGIYLTHFFCVWFAFEYLHQLSLLAKVAIFLLLAAGLPVLFYHLLEEPMIRHGKRVAAQYESTSA